MRSLGRCGCEKFFHRAKGKQHDEAYRTGRAKARRVRPRSLALRCFAFRARRVRAAINRARAGPGPLLGRQRHGNRQRRKRRLEHERSGLERVEQRRAGTLPDLG